MDNVIKEAKAIREITDSAQHSHAVQVCNALATIHTREADKQFTRITDLIAALPSVL